ncbi:lipoprotein [Mesoplasma lactucae]|uniref:Uncharacterized protein n=1 Tax=Mesoplasma lactucae ATCC 49193 TaxID=81460 RepID=A0A291IS65_9MOLU|nr:lipoprotein [Mesoplasma lactucae]ATG97578.1 hypothetical protein CP520_02325 [Mesoplasma lactucae ATCC 49193]ATZ19963.1 hypothetical protein MLACT_v1c01410 [Mesoplasma lactucae ATCC 49193]MCL8217086.1 hypothetical protein [Mesoplasma lactucae ATCC 49193]
MKKLLSILGAVGLTATASSAVVACGSTNDKTQIDDTSTNENKIKELTQKLEEANKQLAQAKEDLNEANGNVKDLTNKLVTASQAMDEATVKFKELENQAKINDILYAAACEALVNTQKELEEAKENNETLTSNLAEKQAAFDAANKKVKQLENDKTINDAYLSIAEEALYNTQKELENTQDQLTEANRAKAQAERNLNDKNNENMRAQNEIAKLKNTSSFDGTKMAQDVFKDQSKDVLVYMFGLKDPINLNNLTNVSIKAKDENQKVVKIEGTKLTGTENIGSTTLIISADGINNREFIVTNKGDVKVLTLTGNEKMTKVNEKEYTVNLTAPTSEKGTGKVTFDTTEITLSGDYPINLGLDKIVGNSSVCEISLKDDKTISIKGKSIGVYTFTINNPGYNTVEITVNVGQ